ncbi:MAG: hypothetical protein GC190_16675 [Alphaproteobacteria bacterium]|nr:hypothetical protein [Alphaproteobacteria bacterium]
MLLLDEAQEVLERTERLAVRSAFALCLAFEMMQRSSSNAAPAMGDLETLRAEVDRVGEALGEILAAREPPRSGERAAVLGTQRLH